MGERLPVPDGLETMPPGPELAALLDQIDIDRVNGYDMILVVEAAARQAAHAQALVLKAVAAVPRRVDGDTDAPAVHVPASGERLQAAVDEVGWALHLTTVSAGRLVMLAETCVEHPGLHAALDQGVLDVPRVQVIADAITVLDRDNAATVVAQALATAPQQTTGQLRQKLARLVVKVDPQAAANRRARAVADRRVARHLDADGTASISALGLPVERAAAAMHRLDGLATGAKQRGDERTLNQLRADLMLDLLDGSYQPPAHPTHTRTAGGGSTASGGAAGGGTAGGDRTGQTGGRAEPAGSQPTSSAASDDLARDDLARDDDGYPGAPPPPWQWPGTLTMTVPLHTLLGLADDPAHLDGWGPIAADIIHRLGLTEMKERRYRYRIEDDTGAFIGEVTARHRFPTAAQKRHIRARDKACRAPGCRVPAIRSDIDHTIDHARGGPTTVDNLCPLCRRHHTGKHQRGFRLEQPRPGYFIWTTPHGHTYHRWEDDTDPPDPDPLEPDAPAP